MQPDCVTTLSPLDFCAKIPKPDPAQFAMATKPFPSFLITKSMVNEVVKRRDKAESTVEKCLWDLVMMFLFTVYPGRDPTKLVAVGGAPGIGR